MSFIPFLIAAGALAVTPGPGVAYVVARTVAGGRTEGLASCLGTGIGGLLHVIAASLGLSLIIAKSAIAFNLLKYIGVANRNSPVRTPANNSILRNSGVTSFWNTFRISCNVL